MPEPLVILGYTARAAAATAQRAGYLPWSVDVRGDRDTRDMGPMRTCPPDEFPTGLLKQIDDAPPDAPVLLTSPLEDYPRLVRAVAFDHPLLGCGPEAIEHARDPLMLKSLKPMRGVRMPATRLHSSIGTRWRGLIFGALGRNKYLVKPRSAGGMPGGRQAIRWWSPGRSVPEDSYLQEYVHGQPYTAVFHADGWSCIPLGVVEPVRGTAAFGMTWSGEFETCGYVGPISLPEKSRSALSRLGVQVTQKHDLRGVFSIDCIRDFRGRLCPVGVHPLYTPAAVILERSLGIVALRGINAAQAAKHASKLRSRRAKAGLRICGMAGVFAREKFTVPDLYERLPRESIADVPAAGRVIGRGEWICTVHADASTPEGCVEALERVAATVPSGVRVGS